MLLSARTTPLFFYSATGDPRDLHSFPTRRSSDLLACPRMHRKEDGNPVGQIAQGVEDPPQGFHLVHVARAVKRDERVDRKSTRLNSSHPSISYAVFCLKKKRGPGVGRVGRWAVPG